MGDLISRSALEAWVRLNYSPHQSIAIIDLEQRLKTIPTAYDVEAVVAELEKSMKESEKDNALFQIASALGEMRAFEYAIKVVRNGGKE